MEKALAQLCAMVRRLYVQWDLAVKNGLLQKLDPRVKLALIATTVVMASLKQGLGAQLLLGSILLGLTLLSKIPLREVQGRAILLAVLFGILLPAPSALNLVNKGEVLIPVLHLKEPARFLWFHVEETVGFTRGGLGAVAVLGLRIMNSVTVTLLVLNTTSFTEIVRALKHFKLPDTLVWVILLTYRYIFVLVNLVEQMHRARSARLVKGTSSAETRKWTAHGIAFVFEKTQLRCQEIFRAMQSRGFSGQVRVEPLGGLAAGDLFGIGMMVVLVGLIAFL
ncbi:MAG: cobalt ECF transporter T component CbiQ [bacterium]